MLKKYWYLIIIIILLIPLFYLASEDEELVEENDKVIEKSIVKKEDENEVEEKNISTTYYVDIKGEVLNPGVYEIEKDKRIIDVVNKAGGLTKNSDVSLINLSKKIYDEMNIKIYSKKEIEAAKSIVNNMYKEKEPEVIEVIKEVEKIVEKECKCEEQVCEKADIFIDNKETLKIEKESNSYVNPSEEKEKIIDEVKNTNVIEDEGKVKNKLVNINVATKDELMTLSGIGESKAIKIIEYRSSNLFSAIEDIKNVPGIGETLFEKIKSYITI